ncbi:MAG: MnmC family methyltransferase [Cyanobacteriota bacterium]
MNYLEKIITNDGTISFYNKAIGDIYHSQVGAYTEALKKFIKPSKIIEDLDNYSNINVLDVCFGLGYNSKVLLTEIIKKDPEKKIKLVGVEIDPNIILKSIEINFDHYPEHLKNFFDSFLHKVYYKTISDRYSYNENFSSTLNNITFELFIGDAREIIKHLYGSFDIIMHDPFSPVKLPELWTVDLFKHIYRLTDNRGRFLTYSASNAVRGGLLEAGYCLGNTEPVGRKGPGTFACKDPSLIDSNLTEYQKLLINTTAGIPFRDPLLNLSSLEIITSRELEQSNSNRISASRIRVKDNQLKNINPQSYLTNDTKNI